jgi:NADPH:quinone reductase-like Zn-dependent oxidoreductase
VKSMLRGFRYSGPEKFAVVEINVPEIGDDDVLVSG